MNAPHQSDQPPTSSSDSPLLDAPEHVLSTLESDGSRRWIFPRLEKGSLWKRRRAFAYFLIIFFVAVPHLRIYGKPPVLLNIPARKFVLLGHTFLPTDTVLLALLILCVFLSIVLATALAGRIWYPGRGEPRKKGRRTETDSAGDCVDCNQCVVVCPTGIDIRDGLQLECINCTQCIDACNSVMDKVGSPQGLIRYSSQDALAGKPPRVLRVRTVAYPLLLTVVAIAFLTVLSTKYAFDANLMRGRGNPFQRTAAGLITNNEAARAA